MIAKYLKRAFAVIVIMILIAASYAAGAIITSINSARTYQLYSIGNSIGALINYDQSPSTFTKSTVATIMMKTSAFACGNGNRLNGKQLDTFRMYISQLKTLATRYPQFLPLVRASNSVRDNDIRMSFCRAKFLKY
jgi:hypothetical protein